MFCHSIRFGSRPLSPLDSLSEVYPRSRAEGSGSIGRAASGAAASDAPADHAFHGENSVTPAPPAPAVTIFGSVVAVNAAHPRAYPDIRPICQIQRDCARWENNLNLYRCWSAPDRWSRAGRCAPAPRRLRPSRPAHQCRTRAADGGPQDRATGRGASAAGRSALSGW